MNQIIDETLRVSYGSLDDIMYRPDFKKIFLSFLDMQTVKKVFEKKEEVK